MSTETTPLVERLFTTRVGKKGQLTVPKEYREVMRFDPGTEVTIFRIGDALILMADLQKSLPEARCRVFARRYPNLMVDAMATGKRQW
jgi:AbrB family looped-hinge helix DNA binding protein